jgi:hypothetical protein
MRTRDFQVWTWYNDSINSSKISMIDLIRDSPRPADDCRVRVARVEGWFAIASAFSSDAWIADV